MFKSVFPLGFIVASRFFGLFIVLPVLSLYVLSLEGASVYTAGLLVGVYAISQMILQVPFGIMSDKFGRKNILTLGLLIFIVGSLICAFASDIYTMILGRVVQGAGAIGAVATAMISDQVREEERTKAMALVGIMIGVSFALSMILSPVITKFFGLSSLFILSAVLSVICIITLYTIVPKESKISIENGENLSFLQSIKDKNLLIINLTNLIQKMFMSIVFVCIPIIFVQILQNSQDDLWKIYLAGMVVGFLAMGFSGSVGEKRQISKQILLAGVVFFGLSFLTLGFSGANLLFFAGIMLFFLGFNMHEPIMQSCATKFAKAKTRGAVLGLFNSFGYFGSFIGGIIGGVGLNFDRNFMFFSLAILSVFWFLLLLKLKNPALFENIYTDKELDETQILAQNGVVEIYKIGSQNAIKFDKSIITKDEILRKIGQI